MKIVIFAGGVGTRLWPLSRKNTPKQFEKIIGDNSTLELAVKRILPLVDPSDIFISSGVAYKDILYQQLPQIPKENFILEPVMRDLGPAVGLVTALFEKISIDEPFIILWSDHLVKNEDLFRKVLKTAGEILKSEKNKIVFIGQRSRFPSQNLGWIELGEEIKKINDLPVFSFKSWQYRPSIEVAEKFHKSNNHVWNPGYFATTPRFLFSLYKLHAPKMYKVLTRIQKAYLTTQYDKVLRSEYESLEKISFDNLILEKIDPKHGYVIKADLGWSDVGAWEALKEALTTAEHENVTRGNVLLEDSSDVLLFNYTNQLTVGIDLSEMIVINTSDVLLICKKSSIPKIKKLVESLAGTPHEHLA